METSTGSKVALVTMPFSFATGPSLGLSLLQGTLRQRGITCDIHYLQLRFAAQIGPELYFRLAQFAPRSLIGEWLFAEQVYGGELPASDTYLEEVLPQYESQLGSGLARSLPWLRQVAANYIESCLHTTLWEQYDVIGFTSVFAQNLASLAMAKRLKQSLPEKIIVFGGANWEGEMGLEMLRQHTFVDFACSGEADWLLPDLVERLASVSWKPTGVSMEGLPGLFYRQGSSSPVAVRLQAQPLKSLDDLPIPDFDDYFQQLSESGLPLRSDEIRLPIETSRGCWWGEHSQCYFCGINPAFNVFRKKSGARALEEFTRLTERYPHTRHFDAVDKIFAMEFFQDLIPGLIEQDLGLDIFYFVKANLNKAQLELLRRAGIRRIQPGIESLDTDALRLMRKGVTASQNIQLLKWSRQAGLEVIWNYISGFPDEDPQAYQRVAEWVDALIHLDPPVGPADPVRLDRFSPYFCNPDAFGMVNVRPAAAYQHVYPFDNNILNRLAYYFDFDYQDRRQPKEYCQILNQAIDRWQARPSQASFTSLRDQDQLILYDRRPGAARSEVVLDGLEKAVYEICDQGRSLVAIQKRLSDMGIKLQAGNHLQPIMAKFVENRWMIHDPGPSGIDHSESGRYLSLAVPIDEPAQVFIDQFVARLEAETKG